MKKLTGIGIDQRVLDWADEVYKENEPYRRATKGGTGQKEYTTGDILYASSAYELAKLGIGLSGQYLKSTGSAPSWATPPVRGWEIVTDYTVSGSAVSTITVSNLTGNTDEFYMFEMYVIGAVVSEVAIRPNSDSTANNYRYQYLQVTNATVAAGRADYTNGLVVGNTNTIGDLMHAVGWISAKSGQRRPMIVYGQSNINATTLDLFNWSTYWKNTADEITSLVFRSSGAGSPIGVGSRLRLWKAVTT
jgi:hypothetical protein